MDETFLLTNILPQNKLMNAGVWRELEQYCRALTTEYDDVRVVSGTLRLPESSGSSGDQKFVKYEVSVVCYLVVIKCFIVQTFLKCFISKISILLFLFIY